MELGCVWEHNGNDTLLYAADFTGTYTRGASLRQALDKMPAEVRAYCRWLGRPAPDVLTPVVVQEKASALAIRDADSDVLLDTEGQSLTQQAYDSLKALALRSAEDFLTLYNAIPEKEKSALPVRTTFYGEVPRTAEQMYQHTKNVNSYYFGEVGVETDNEGDILSCRQRGFDLLEQQPDFLSRLPCTGSYGEVWSVAKVLRRFVWHDRIHAKAMWRMAEKTFGKGVVPNVFLF